VSAENIVEFSNVSLSFGSHVVLDNVSFGIPAGKVSAIMGPSGCGKTSVLRLIGRQISPNSGHIIFDNKELSSLNRRDLYTLRKDMGMLFQSGALFTDLNVFDNVAFPLREHTKLPASMIRNLVLMKLQAVGLRGAINLNPSELSGGMARRAALARAIALDPKFIMYDEPFAGQDPISMGVLVQLIKLLNDALKMTSVLVSHDIHETASIADHIILLSNGKVMGSGSPEELLNSHNEWIRQFMQGLPDGPVPFHYPARDYGDDLMESENC
jgi:phospholipid/cholesterol/gamma-HCH transport system ATP-binding protein